MNRKNVRDHAFKILFQLEFFTKEILVTKLDPYFINMEILEEKDKSQILEFVQGVINNIDKIDDIINSTSKGWKTERMPATDLAILRIAVYELLHSDLSIKIIANEAVELAKMYSTEESPKFINALIGQIYKKL